MLRDTTGRYTDRNGAEGVGFEPTDSLLSSAFKALALGHYANPPKPAGRPGLDSLIQLGVDLPGRPPNQRGENQVPRRYVKFPSRAVNAISGR